MNPVLAVDFDGTLVRKNAHGTVEPMPNARSFLERLVRAGWKIIVHSSRANWEGGREEIERAMHAFGLPYHEIVAKPLATVYLDNRGLHFEKWQSAYADIIRA